MIPIALVIVGIILLFKESVSLSSNREVRKGREKALGLITIASGITSYFVSSEVAEPFSANKMNAIYYFAPVLAPLVSLFFLNQEKLQTTPMSKTNSVANVLTWIILIGVVVFAIWLLYSSS